jgi:excisionase family DNA binding protein
MIKNFMTTGELREYLGISLSSVYKMSHKNVLPKYRPTGRKVYFLKDDVDALLKRNRISSIDELNYQLDVDDLLKGGVS